MVTEVYRQTRLFPKEELYGLTSQIRRCAVSIPSNIAEGYGRHATQDYLRFLNIARGSLYELQTQLTIALNLEYLADDKYHQIHDLTREIERMLSALISKIESS